MAASADSQYFAGHKWVAGILRSTNLSAYNMIRGAIDETGPDRWIPGRKPFHERLV
jgi:hypothetical protein